MNKQRIDEIRARAEAVDTCVYFMKEGIFRDLAKKDIKDLLEHIDDLRSHLAIISIEYPHLVPEEWSVRDNT